MLGNNPGAASIYGLHEVRHSGILPRGFFPMSMIEVRGLSKYYGEHAAIADLNFSIARGEVIGFLGLNGAGKTTTLKVLGCVLLPTAGVVTVDGIDIARDPHEVRRRIGFLPDTPPLYNEMTVGRYLAFVAQLRGVPAAEVAKAVAEAEVKTATLEKHDHLISSLSHGFRQRVGVAQAIVHRPQLLILDEPTSGLDPQQIKEMRHLIGSLRGSHTILLSSHILTEISQTCDRLLVIDNGRIIGQGTEADLAAKVNVTGTIELEVAAFGDRALAVVRSIDGVAEASVVREEGGVAALSLRAPAELRPRVARALVENGIDLLRIDKGATKLESIFLELTTHPGGAEAAPADAQAAPPSSPELPQ
jgi:ABC-2 type transport system ATP-binding protein